MRGKGLVVKYNVPMRYAGRKVLALAYLAGRRSGLRDLAARAFFDHSIRLLCDSIGKHVPGDVSMFALPMLRKVGGSDFLAKLAQDPKRVDALLEGFEKSADTPGVCRVCGCTESTPCHSAPGQAVATCGWADEWRTLCTFCAPSSLRQIAPGSFAARAAEGIDAVMARKALGRTVGRDIPGKAGDPVRAGVAGTVVEVSPRPEVEAAADLLRGRRKGGR